LDTRRKQGKASDYKSFQDLIEIFPQSYIDLLAAAYESVEDIDLYVGGALDSFLLVDKSLAGDVFGQIILDQYKRAMAGDIYYFSHPLNPYPFTPAQLEAIVGYNFNSLMCNNAGLDSIPPYWFLVENPLFNSQIPCAYFQPLNLAAWKEV
jgi:Animal haem peroxidase